MPVPDATPEPSSSGREHSPNGKPPEFGEVLKTPRLRFALGRIVITASANAILTQADVILALRRHSCGDWGDVSASDAKANERGVRDQGTILSAYRSVDGVKFWVITDPGHEVTTVLLPEDY